MEEQPQVEIIGEMVPETASEKERKEKLKAKQKRTETIGFAIMILGFATLLIPNPITGKYGEYTMFAGAIMYFSGRFIK